MDACCRWNVKDSGGGDTDDGGDEQRLEQWRGEECVCEFRDLRWRSNWIDHAYGPNPSYRIYAKLTFLIRGRMQNVKVIEVSFITKGTRF